MGEKLTAETRGEFESQAKTFRALGRLFAKQETSDSVAMAAVCFGLAEFCEAVARGGRRLGKSSC